MRHLLKGLLALLAASMVLAGCESLGYKNATFTQIHMVKDNKTGEVKAARISEKFGTARHFYVVGTTVVGTAAGIYAGSELAGVAPYSDLAVNETTGMIIGGLAGGATGYIVGDMTGDFVVQNIMGIDKYEFVDPRTLKPSEIAPVPGIKPQAVQKTDGTTCTFIPVGKTDTGAVRIVQRCGAPLIN